MPRAESALRLLALTALSMAPGLANALCEPLAASAQRQTLVADIALDSTHTLLALDGSRIPSWQTAVTVETGARARPVVWAERVDWSVYAAAPDARIGVTMLRFETGANGRRHLCGIARYSASAVDAAREAGKAALPAPDAETRYYYGDGDRLTGYEERSRAADGRPNPPVRYCLRYDEHGWLAELGANDCAAPSQPITRYVHDAEGQLQRVITYQDASGEASQVDTYDGQGRRTQRHARQKTGWTDGVQTLGLPYREVPSEYAVLVLPGPAWQPPALDSYHYDWAIVRPRSDNGDHDVYAAKRDPAQVLAKGNSGNSGNGSQFALTAEQKQRIWDAAGQTPGGVQWLWAPGQIFTLLQALPRAAWAACTDPANRTADACGTP